MTAKLAKNDSESKSIHTPLLPYQYCLGQQINLFSLSKSIYFAEQINLISSANQFDLLTHTPSKAQQQAIYLQVTRVSRSIDKYHLSSS